MMGGGQEVRAVEEDELCGRQPTGFAATQALASHLWAAARAGWSSAAPALR